MQTPAMTADGTGSLARTEPMLASIATSTLNIGRRTSHTGTARGRLEDVLLALLAVFLFPVGILLIGTPLALVARLVLEIVRRL